MLCKIERAWTEGCLAAQAVCELVSFDEINGIMPLYGFKELIYEQDF